MVKDFYFRDVFGIIAEFGKSATGKDMESVFSLFEFFMVFDISPPLFAWAVSSALLFSDFQINPPFL